MPLSGALDQAARLPPGTKVTVTCSPSRGLAPTLDLSERLAEAGLDVVPHLAARATTGKAELRDALSRLSAVGVDDVFVVGGDGAEPAGPYASGIDLLATMSDLGHEFSEVGIPAYPEGHAFIDDETLHRAAAEKAPFATYMVTQMCFDGAVLARWLADLRERGIGLTVSFGVPGVVEARKLARISAKVGVGESSRFARKNAKAIWRLLRPGGYRADKLLRTIATQLPLDSDVTGIHLFTFNEVDATYDWVARQAAHAGRNGGA